MTDPLREALKRLVEPGETVQVVIGSLNGVPSRFLIAPEALFEQARAVLAATPAPPEPLDVEALRTALEATDMALVDNDLSIVTQTGDLEEVAAAYARAKEGK